MENSCSIKDKIALITGGATGIGFGIAKEFIAHGAKVIITGRQISKLETAKKDLGENCTIFQNDVTDKHVHPQLIAKIENEIGPIDILVNNAGKHLKKPALKISDEEFFAVTDVNLFSVFALTRECLKYMIQRGNGSVIFISSMSALYGLTDVVAYSSSKTALIGLSRSLASEYSKVGIRFNVIAPGFIESEMFSKIIKKDPERLTRILERTPMNRLGKPSEIGKAALFLASNASEFITGVCLPVDGGNSIGF